MVTVGPRGFVARPRETRGGPIWEAGRLKGLFLGVGPDNVNKTPDRVLLLALGKWVGKVASAIKKSKRKTESGNKPADPRWSAGKLAWELDPSIPPPPSRPAPF